MSLHATAAKKVKFAAQLAPDVLETPRRMSADEGRHLQAILDEALREYIENRQVGYGSLYGPFAR